MIPKTIGYSQPTSHHPTPPHTSATYEFSRQKKYLSRVAWEIGRGRGGGRVGVGKGVG